MKIYHINHLYIAECNVNGYACNGYGKSNLEALAEAFRLIRAAAKLELI